MELFPVKLFILSFMDRALLVQWDLKERYVQLNDFFTLPLL